MLKTVLICVWMATAVSAAELVEVPLDVGPEPRIVGSGSNVLFAFDAGRPLEAVDRVSLRLTGTHDHQSGICWQFGDFGGGVSSVSGPAGLVASTRVDHSVLHKTVHEFPMSYETIPFEVEFPLVADGDDLAWETLAAGTGTVHLTGLPCDFGSYPIVCSCDAWGTVATATLVIVLGTGVPVNDHSWSTIKALYR